MIGYDARREFATLQRHQHAAAGKRIDERSRVANCQQTIRRRDLMPAKTLQRNREPRGASTGVCQRKSSAGVLTDNLAHHALSIRGAGAHVTRRRDKTEITATVFNAAQTAVTAAIKINLAGAGRDARVFKMGFESHEGSTIRFRPLLFNAPVERAHATRGVNRDWRAVTDLVSGALQSDAANFCLL